MPIISKKTTQKSLIKQLDMSLDFLPIKYEKETEYHCLSVGQFNLIDIIEDVVEKIGKCSIDLAVWTAADSNLKKAFEFLQNHQVEKMRWIVDPSFKSRQPKYVETLYENFGADAVRTIPTHAKFIILYNDKYNIIIQTSMNLNQNKRLESFTIIESAELVDFYKTFVDNVFNKTEVNANFTSQDTRIINDLFQSDNTDWNF
jgi:hypothetical protein